MQTGLTWWKRFYQLTKLPLVPLYGGFPVKLTTHVGEPIHPDAFNTVEAFREAAFHAMEGLIEEHQVRVTFCFTCTRGCNLTFLSDPSWKHIESDVRALGRRDSALGDAIPKVAATLEKT